MWRRTLTPGGGTLRLGLGVALTLGAVRLLSVGRAWPWPRQAHTSGRRAVWESRQRRPRHVAAALQQGHGGVEPPSLTA